MNQETNRLLMELERTMRNINREVINPQIEALTVERLKSVLCLVARARARYLRAFFDLGGDGDEQVPSECQLEDLARLRREYEELLSAAKALEAAIQRGYLDVEGR